jgi:thiamine-monophosphate kinase
LDARAVPVAPGVAEMEAWGGTTGLALSGGDDYELCLAIPPDGADALTRALAPTAVTVIGRFVEGGGVDITGGEAPAAAGWDSFR